MFSVVPVAISLNLVPFADIAFQEDEEGISSSFAGSAFSRSMPFRCSWDNDREKHCIQVHVTHPALKTCLPTVLTPFLIPPCADTRAALPGIHVEKPRVPECSKMDNRGTCMGIPVAL
eukprot:m.310535 g.310535  ORF g.310535 m.310535 type:complete len:118 (+) comp16383_c0_seq4:1117-1470(+)